MSGANDRLLRGQRLLLGALLAVMAGSALLLWRMSGRTVRGPRDGRGPAEVEAAARPSAAAEAPSTTEAPAARTEERVALTGTAPSAALDASALETFAPDACYGRTLVAGEPAPGVELAFFLDTIGFGETRAPVATARSDEAGRFRLTGLLAHRGYAVALRGPLVVPKIDSAFPGEPLTFELEPAVPVTGVVQRASDGRALADVNVAVARAHWNGTRRVEFLEARTDAEGRFALAGVGEGLVTFHLARPGHLAERREFQVTAASATPFEILLEDANALEFLAVDLASGNPLVATELVGPAGPLRTDDAGHLFLPRPARPEEGLRVSLAHPNDVQTEGRLSASGGPLARVPVAHGARVRGRVVDAAGAPVADALVRIVGGGRGSNVPGLPEGFRLSDPRRTVHSDAEGRFEFPGCTPRGENVRVRATHPLHPQGESEPFALARLDQELEVEVRLEAGGALSGRVTLEGEPVALDVHWNDAENSGRTRSNARGEFRLEGLAPGELTLRARLDDEDEDVPRPEDRTLLVTAGETLAVELALTRSGATIEGRVLDAGGAPVPEAQLMAYIDDEEEGELETPYTQSARDGSFTLTLPAGVTRPFHVFASEGPRRIERRNVAPGTRGLELVLPELGRAPLRVEDALTRAPINGYSLYWRPSDEGRYERFSPRSARLSAGPDGVYLAELPLGRLDLVVCERSRGYVPCFREGVVVTREAGAEVRFALESGVELELVLAGAPELRNELRRAFVESAEQAELSARGGDFYQQEIRSAQGLRPDGNGSVRLKGMPAGRYEVKGLARGLVLTPAAFELTSVASERLEFALSRRENRAPAQPGGKGR